VDAVLSLKNLRQGIDQIKRNDDLLRNFFITSQEIEADREGRRERILPIFENQQCSEFDREAVFLSYFH